ncbi:hypothetical protein EZY14_008990 [Kordia sp. TARA_039_SRF]|nr:hypothetical protein EZY14_008990 [Kordia sp. TARA_039_SRF]
MKKITILLSLLVFVSAYSQTELLKSKGVEVTYQLIKEKETRNKNKFIMMVSVVNTSNEDYYYTVSSNANTRILQGDGFVKVKVRNSSGWLGDGKAITGEPTEYVTVDNDYLYVIKAGEMYNSETTFRIKKNREPLITGNFTKTLKTLEEFDLKVDATMINGDWISSCGNIRITLSHFAANEKRREYILQTVNGKQFTWIRNSENSYVREDNTGYSLTFNKDAQTFTYSSEDGISCEWKK